MPNVSSFNSVSFQKMPNNNKAQIDFTLVEFPATVSLNTFCAYFNLSDVKLPKIHGKLLQSTSNAGTGGNAANGAGDTNEIQTNQTKSLRHLVLDAITDNWNVSYYRYNVTLEYPIYAKIPRREDRNYILSHLDVNLPLKLLSTHIQDDYFWWRSYQQRWKMAQQQLYGKERRWINIYMERHLQEFIENMQTCDYDVECAQTTLDICAAYINQLTINFLQPAAMGERNDHIPLDYILSNLPELHKLRLTYCTKTVGTNFYLGCNMLSQNDIVLLAKGLSRCHELRNFCLHNTKLIAYQMRLLAHSLDKGCHHLTTLELQHCAIGDEGIRTFLQACVKESFATLKCLDLTNNKITEEGTYVLSRTLQGIALEKLVLRLNPIQSDGAAAIFHTLQYMPIKVLDLGTCSITDSLTKLFMMLILQNKTLISIDITNNYMGEDFGKHMLKIIGLNKVLQELDLRNTGLSLEQRQLFKQILLKNIEKAKHEETKKLQQKTKKLMLLRHLLVQRD